MVHGDVAGEGVLGLAVLPTLWAGVAEAGEMFSLQVLTRSRQVAAYLVAEAAAVAALDFDAVCPHRLLQEVGII